MYRCACPSTLHGIASEDCCEPVTPELDSCRWRQPARPCCCRQQYQAARSVMHLMQKHIICRTKFAATAMNNPNQPCHVFINCCMAAPALLLITYFKSFPYQSKLLTATCRQAAAHPTLPQPQTLPPAAHPVAPSGCSACWSPRRCAASESAAEAELRAACEAL